MADDERRATDFMRDLPIAQNDALKATERVLMEVRANELRAWDIARAAFEAGLSWEEQAALEHDRRLGFIEVDGILVRSDGK